MELVKNYLIFKSEILQNGLASSFLSFIAETIMKMLGL